MSSVSTNQIYIKYDYCWIKHEKWARVPSLFHHDANRPRALESRAPNQLYTKYAWSKSRIFPALTHLQCQNLLTHLPACPTYLCTYLPTYPPTYPPTHPLTTSMSPLAACISWKHIHKRNKTNKLSLYIHTYICPGICRDNLRCRGCWSPFSSKPIIADSQEAVTSIILMLRKRILGTYFQQAVSS